MTGRRRALGRGLDDVLHASFASIVEAPSPAEETEASRAAAPRVVAIASGKGGTGKSVVTSNLAVILAPGSTARVLDADFGLANLHLLYGLMPQRTAADVIAGEASLADVTLTGPRGVRLIPGGSGLPEMAGMSQATLRRLASSLAPLDTGGGWLLIDTPGGIETQSILFLLAADMVLIVTTEDITALTDAYAMIKTLLTHRPTATVVVAVNQVRSHDSALAAFQRLAHVARRFLGRELALGAVIPLDDAVDRSIAARVPVVLREPAAPAAGALTSLAAGLPRFGADTCENEPFSSRLLRLLDGPLFARR